MLGMVVHYVVNWKMMVKENQLKSFFPLKYNILTYIYIQVTCGEVHSW